MHKHQPQGTSTVTGGCLLAQKAVRDDTANSHLKCYSFCRTGKVDGSSYKYFVIEFGRDCRCSDVLADPVLKTGECDKAASGAPTEAGGGTSRIDV
jgi:hypothetical protein